MRPNRHGIRHFKSYTYKDGHTAYFWSPPAIAREIIGPDWIALGTDRELAIRITNKLNQKVQKLIEETKGRPLH